MYIIFLCFLFYFYFAGYNPETDDRAEPDPHRHLKGDAKFEAGRGLRAQVPDI